MVRRRVSAVVILVAIAIATVERVFAAFEERDFETLCSLFSPCAVADVIIKTEETPKGRSLPVELELGPDGWLVTRQVITG